MSIRLARQVSLVLFHIERIKLASVCCVVWVNHEKQEYKEKSTPSYSTVLQDDGGGATSTCARTAV